MQKEKPLLELYGIFTAVWLLVLLGTILIFDLIVPFHYWGGIYDSFAKGIFASILALIWLYAFILLRDAFVRRNIPSKESKQVGNQPASQ